VKTPKQSRLSAAADALRALAPRHAVVGLEAEFTLVVDGLEQRPERVFGTPANLLRHHDGPLIPRTGRSCHLPSGGALYFDTGVIEVATALIELEAPGGCERAVRSLWEQIAFLRQHLDAWETRRGREMRLRGFSAHYNFSLPSAGGGGGSRLRRLARLLCYVLPIPVMLLAANRRSTAIGARPRPGRIEITADFTPDPALTTTALAFLAGVVTEMARWPDADLTTAGLTARGLPLLANFWPSRHSSRRGWRGHADDFAQNPFRADSNAESWLLTDGRSLSLRAMAREIGAVFQGGIRRFADRATRTHLREIFRGQARSLLDFDDAPPAYEDVGRQIDWGRRRSRPLPRSAYEKVIRRIVAHEPWRIGRSDFMVERMPGWYEFVFRNVKTGARRTFNLDELARRLA
jgi:hypothetical protein